MPTVHLLCAALLWSGAGIFLLVRGIILLKNDEYVWLIGAGVLLGLIKSRMILDRVARDGVARIAGFTGTICIGAVYSWKTWLLVLAMMVFGIALRRLQVTPLLVGGICVAVGSALVYSSRFAWEALRVSRKGD
ncbi:MAG: hypothetical protein RBS34_05955 [Desulfofustis sp.]|nr:hypothetical protein [Desulfofustis sp.]